MTSKFSTALLLIAMLAMLLAGSIVAKQLQSDKAKNPASLIDNYNLQYPNQIQKIEKKGAEVYHNRTNPTLGATLGRSAVGATASPSNGSGYGVAIDETWYDEQKVWDKDLMVASSVIGNEIDVHFIYTELADTLDLDATQGTYYGKLQTGYQIYDACNTANHWPQNIGQGCELQTASADSAFGRNASLDIRPSGLAVIGAHTSFHDGNVTSNTNPWNRTNWQHAGFFYQDIRHGCDYFATGPLQNYSHPDTLDFQDPSNGGQLTGGLPNDAGILGMMGWPVVKSEMVGGQTVVHAVMDDNNGWTAPGGDLTHADNIAYYAKVYARKIGDDALGTWGNFQMIDTIWWHFTSMALDPTSDRVVVAYSSTGDQWGGVLDVEFDSDIYYRESPDGGVSWNTRVNATKHQNPIPADPRHLKTWLDCRAFFSTDGVLHLIYGAEPTSEDPYNDGFNWQNFGSSLYHWSEANTPDPDLSVVKMANGTWTDPVTHLGSGLNVYVCSYTPANTKYIGWPNISECNNRLYATYNAYHSKANDAQFGAWENDITGILDDCGYTGDRSSGDLTNGEIFLTVSNTLAGNLWDKPRNLTQTYTPDCSWAGDPDAPGGTPTCGNEHKPQVENYAIDETGLCATWPVDVVLDASALNGGPAYTGSFFLNAMYIDDQYPGAWMRTGAGAKTNNSMKWVRIACVDPIQEALFSMTPPDSITWPNWVKAGSSKNFAANLVNDGNLALNITSIVASDPTWLSTDISPIPKLVDPKSESAFNVVIDASSVPSGTPTWLDGTLTFNNSSTNAPVKVLNIHVLAADTVVDLSVDTVGTGTMFDALAAAAPAAERVGLAITNNGEMGNGATTGASLDFSLSGEECGTRIRDSLYLMSGSPFSIIATSSTPTTCADVELSMSINSVIDQSSALDWDPVVTPGAIAGSVPSSGLTATYDSVYAGKFVNRDTSIAWEKTYYAPRDAVDPGEFVIVLSRIYSGDGASHAHVTLGHAIDWDVPTDTIPANKAAVSSPGGYAYQQGADTVGHVDPLCSHEGRYATEALVSQWNNDVCTRSEALYASYIGDQLMMEDTNLCRSGETLAPLQADPLAWWQETSNPGLAVDGSLPTLSDKAQWTTFYYDITVGPSDTFTVITVLTTVRDGAESDLLANVTAGRAWAKSLLINPLLGVCSCCIGTVGDANMVDDVTVGDIAAIVNMKFGTGQVPVGQQWCLDEADANLTAATAGHPVTLADISVGDIADIVNFKFGDGTPLPPCP